MEHFCNMVTASLVSAFHYGTHLIIIIIMAICIAPVSVT